VTERIKIYEQKQAEVDFSKSMPAVKKSADDTQKPKHSAPSSISKANVPANLERNTQTIARTNSFFLKNGVGILTVEKCPVCG
jgi:hypothetical protein